MSHLTEIYIVQAALTQSYITIWCSNLFHSIEKACSCADLPSIAAWASRCWWLNPLPVKQEQEKHPGYDDYIGGLVLPGSRGLAEALCDYSGPVGISGYCKVFLGLI